MATPTREDFKGTPFADLPVDLEEDWNPSGAKDSDLMAAILGPNGDDWAAFKRANLAYAPGADFGGDPPTQYNAYKLKVARRYPATDPKGTLKVNFRQLANRVGVLNGGREGAELTEEARRQAYAHATKYYAKVDKEPPALRANAARSEVEWRMFDLETVDLRIVRHEGEPLKIVGHGAVFNKWSLPISGYFRERILPGAFAKTLRESPDIPSLYNHDPNMVLGRTSNGRLELKEDETGLWFQVTPTETTYARDLLVNIEEGNVTGNSFGFVAVKDRWGSEGEMTTREIVEARLLDVGPVTFPAYPQTDVAVRKLIEWEQRIGRRLQGKRLEQLVTVATNLKDVAGALEELISWARQGDDGDDDGAPSRSDDHLAVELERLRRRPDVRLRAG